MEKLAVEFKPGDIGFVMHHDNWISKTIGKVMGSKWSHSFLILEQTDQRTYLIETSDFEVCMAPLDRYFVDPNTSLEIYSPLHVNEEDRYKIVGGAMKTFGQVYGYLQLISLGIRRLLMKVGIQVPNFFRSGLVCCAVPLYGLSKSPIPGFKGIDAESIDTQELYEKVIDPVRDPFRLVVSKKKGEREAIIHPH